MERKAHFGMEDRYQGCKEIEDLNYGMKDILLSYHLNSIVELFTMAY